MGAAGFQEEALYSLPSFGLLEQLTLSVLGRATARELAKAILKFLIKYAENANPAVRSRFTEFAPRLSAEILQRFHLWPQACKTHASKLFEVMLSKHRDAFFN